MSSVLSIIRFYAKQPSLALKHANIALRVLRSDGPSALKSRVRTLSGTITEENRRAAEKEEVYSRLANIPVQAKRHVISLTRDLQPFADDLSVIDVIYNDDDRLRVIHCHLLKKRNLFDEEFYTNAYMTDVSGFRPIDHYIQFGLPGGLKPNPFFDPVHYVSAYPDVADYGMDPVLHYDLFGWREKRSAGALFDGQFYLDTNPDVVKAGLSPLRHFLAWGRAERRIPLPRPISTQSAIRRDRGTILLVSHDAELGGAQQVLKTFARWLLASTKFDVKFVTMRSGGFASGFREIADTFDIGAQPDDLSREELIERLKSWAGDDVKALFLNSVASGGFLDLWQDDTPTLAYIHELPKILESHREELGLIEQRAKSVIGCSTAVSDALDDRFGFGPDQLRTSFAFIQSVEPSALIDFDGKRDAKLGIGVDPDTILIAGCGVMHWRKAPDKFVEVARKVVDKLGTQVSFIWVGGGPDQAKCERMVRQLGLEKHVRFLGYQSDVLRYLSAADLFLLTSEEDPFPLVCLEAAMALSPVICFEDAGGMPGFVSRGCGQAVPFMDVDAMAAAVLRYVEDEALRQSHARMGRSLVQSEYTERVAGPRLLHHIRQAAGLKPYVSVVVPNYNYETFLPERLQTIADQTFQDFELILLDDCSVDGSVEILREWEERRPGTKLTINKKNTGSPFAQWLTGIEQAESDLIWIAEADDSCKPELLATLVPCFEDRNIFLAYVKSVPIGADGQVFGDYEDLYLNRIAEGRWSTPYVVTDHEEAESGLGIANCIPNASSVVFRKFKPEDDFAAKLRSMRLAGDWYFYLRAMRGGLVAYNQQALNLHRRHAETVTKSTEGTMRYFDEFADVRAYIGETYDLSQEAEEKIQRFTAEDLDRFGVSDAKQRAQILGRVKALTGQHNAAPALLVVLSDLSPGGGQILGIRLANAWASKGWRVVVLNVRHFPDHPKVAPKIDQRVAIFNVGETHMTMANLIERFDIDVVHSMIWWADRHVHENIVALGKRPWVITLHGCYELMIDNPLIDMSLPERVPEMLQRAAWIHTAEKNRTVFKKYGSPKLEMRVDNGIVIEAAHPLSSAELGLRENATVLCLASRGIREKGWHEAVEMAIRLNEKGIEVDLMLLGQGPAHDELLGTVPPYVHLVGHVENPQDYMRSADLGLLPSYYTGESMPMVLLEMMANGIPVIATDVGEIPDMVGQGKDAGGVIVPLKAGAVDIEGFVDAISALSSPTKRKAAGKKAKQRFESRFTIDRMIAAYRKLYDDLARSESLEDDDSSVQNDVNFSQRKAI